MCAGEEEEDAASSVKDVRDEDEFRTEMLDRGSSDPLIFPQNERKKVPKREKIDSYLLSLAYLIWSRRFQWDPLEESLPGTASASSPPS